MNICHVVGARPNFMKAAPVLRALRSYAATEQFVVHTGQHYDFNMSDVFFQQLEMAPPDINLQVGSGSHAQQTAQIMSRFEPVVLERKPDLVLVYGDVNSTVAAALVCAKLGTKLGHVEAGLRSSDRSMPEEINRLLTDQLADLLFTPSVDGNINLAREGISEEKVHLVGNVMIDTVVRMLPAARQTIAADLPEHFALVTLHRPANVDVPEWLDEFIKALVVIGKQIPVLFPVHPRTRQQLLARGKSLASSHGILLMNPLPYLEFLGLQTRATVVVTDSGGIQEETTFLGVPCLTVRENTERPITVTTGTNLLVGRDPQKICAEVKRVLSGNVKRTGVPPLWDGHAAERIASVIKGKAAGTASTG
jgi:UDP-N-acetylglucosamine 2-epimerase (non-hydrolysing)